MNTPQAQIKINLPVRMKDYIESKANKFGMPVSGYIKHLILKDVENMDYPIYQASERTEKAYSKAETEYDSGKLVKVKDVDTFFEEL